MAVAWLRIDDRLIHGQVVEAWIPALSIDDVIVFDDAAAGDETRRALMRLALPDAVGLEVVAGPGLGAALGAAAARPGKTMVLVESPSAALTALEAGVPVPRVNVGGMHHSAGKVQLGRAIFLDDADREALRAIRARGVELDGRAVPGEESINFEGFL